MASHNGQIAVKRSVAGIRRLYELGERLKEFPKPLPRGKGERIAAAAGTNRDMVEKSRRFVVEFSRRDLNTLCREIESGGFPVGVQHVVRLTWIKGEKRRWSFLRRTIEERWGVRELLAAIQQSTGRRPRGGRRIRIRDRAHALTRMLGLCEHWNRLYKALKNSNNGGGAPGLKLSPAIRHEVDACDSAVNQLYGRLLKTR